MPGLRAPGFRTAGQDNLALPATKRGNMQKIQHALTVLFSREVDRGSLLRMR